MIELNRFPPEQGDDVPCDPATIRDQRALLLGDLTPGQQPTSFGADLANIPTLTKLFGSSLFGMGSNDLSLEA
jgi:hypothetical protein